MRHDKCLQLLSSLYDPQNKVKSMITVDFQAVIGIKLLQVLHKISLWQVSQEFLTFEWMSRYCDTMVELHVAEATV